MPDKLTDEEYGRELRAVWAAGLDSSRQGSLAELKRREFNLAVDHRLGRDFDPARRQELVDAFMLTQELLAGLNREFLRRLFAPRRHARRLAQLQRRLLHVFAAILTPAEFRDFTGIPRPDDAPPVADPRRIPPHRWSPAPPRP